MAERSKTMTQLKFVAKSLNELCCNEYGSPIFVETADKVFEDILGVRHLVSKLYMVDNLQKAVSIVNEVGFETMIKMFDQSAYRDAIEDMIHTRDRIDQLRKESKKLYRKINESDGKRKHREQDLVSYKQKTKEIRYATDIYESAIKRLRKYLGIKNPKKKGINKERYAFLKNFAKRSEDGFFNGGFMDDAALGDYAFDGFESLYSLANDAGHTYVNSMKTGLRDEDEDEDDGEGNYAKFLEEEKRAAKKMNRFTQPVPSSGARRKVRDLPDFINSADEMRRLELDYENDDDDDEEYDEDEADSRDIARDLRVDPEIDARLDALNEKYEMLGRTLSKVIPSTRDTFENQREKDESREEMMEQILQTLGTLTSKIVDMEKRSSKIDKTYSTIQSQMAIASREYQDAKESYEAIREMLIEIQEGADDEDEDDEAAEEIRENIGLSEPEYDDVEYDESDKATDLEIMSMKNTSDYVPSGPRSNTPVVGDAFDEDDEETLELRRRVAEQTGRDLNDPVEPLNHYPKDALRKLADPEWIRTHQDVEIIRKSVQGQVLNEPIIDVSPENSNQATIAPGVDKT